jgi:hypothetical protein
VQELNPNLDDKTFTDLMETLHRRYMNNRHEQHAHDFRKVTPEVLVGLFDDVLRGISKKQTKLQPEISRDRQQGQQGLGLAAGRRGSQAW